MSEDDDPEIPQPDIEEEFARAEQMLADARKATEVGISKATIVNRLYYACFHAAQGALYANRWSAQSHGSVQTVLGRELIEEGDVSREWGQFLNDMYTYRRRVDYGSGDVKQDTDDLIRRTSAFVAAMRETTDVAPSEE